VEILTCAQKLTSSQLNLAYGIENEKVIKQTETKYGRALKNCFRRKVREVSSEERREGLWWEGFLKKVGCEPEAMEK